MKTRTGILALLVMLWGCSCLDKAADREFKKVNIIIDDIQIQGHSPFQPPELLVKLRLVNANIEDVEIRRLTYGVLMGDAVLYEGVVKGPRTKMTIDENGSILLEERVVVMPDMVAKAVQAIGGAGQEPRIRVAGTARVSTSFGNFDYEYETENISINVNALIPKFPVPIPSPSNR